MVTLRRSIHIEVGFCDGPTAHTDSSVRRPQVGAGGARRCHRALVVAAATVLQAVRHGAGRRRPAAPGAGFTVTAGDLRFILKQIKIAERHAATLTATQPVRHAGRARTANQIPDRLTTYGLRTVDGSCNNLFPGRETFAAADQSSRG